MLQNINRQVRDKTNLQQWQSTGQAIEWFKNIKNKGQKEFIQCDIESFYPTISEALLEDSIDFARNYTYISETTKETIMNARKTILVNDVNTWQKVDSLFDVAMGANDGAEIAELVGLKILNDIREHVPEIDFGLYRDDGIAVTNTGSGQKMENIKKKLVNVFKESGLKITIQIRLHKVNFLDVSFNLHEDTYKPFKKPDNEIKYIDINSDHPKSIKRGLPKMVQNRLSGLSKNKEIFDENCKDYEEALKKSGYKDKLEYKEPKTETNEDKKDKQKKKTRKRNVLWYNPPFSESIDDNIGQKFLKLIDKHFGKTRKDKLHKIINRKTVKVGYSCGQNFGNMIKGHNKRLLNKHTENNQQSVKKCNCRTGTECPLKGECKVEAVVYKAKVKQNNDNNTVIYIGSTEGDFKQRLYQHKSDMKHEKNRNKTTLTKYFWDLKDKGVSAEIEWEILKKCKKYESGEKKCDVCLSEKLEILKGKRRKERMLNKRNELMYKCPHKRKFILEP